MAQALHTNTQTKHYIRVAQVSDVKASGFLVVYAEGQAIALFNQGDKIYAIDNRCPHMGFPLHRGTVKDCILTCHWHHARFDLASGGTFDAWADDVRAFPTEIRDGQVWVDLAPHADPVVHQRQRLQDMHTCMINLLPYLDPEDRPRALYHGLAAVARDCAGQPPRFGVQPLPTSTPDIDTLQRWFRQFIEVRDAEGAERCLVSAVRGGASQRQIAEMLFTTATDHRYIDVGHVVDFTNKALEALDATHWQNAESVLTSLVSEYASAERMEESNSWRYPVDLVAILQRAFAELPAALESGQIKRGNWSGREELVKVLLGEDAQALADSLVEALRAGCSEEELASAVVYAAALRIAHFHTNNDFGDWDTAHHTFTFANAVHQGLRRVPSQALLRGVFDAAMSTYLNRFLNVPPARLPEPNQIVENPEQLLHQLPELLDRQQQVNEAGSLVARYLYSGGNPDRLLALLGKLLLREDRSFHVIQEIEAAFRQYSLLGTTEAGIHVLIAAARYLAAHAPTMRSQAQTYQMAERLYRGDRVFEEA
ncbi:MAG: Rieske 2Fe-2S domain-containing protein [Chlorogloeopsis fritschii C42_A2020_084]|uniref:Rieske (2Fe-2S) protein n=1 Tax=Chlorogloeopsis fritschii TaxID=1124 RepID=UPI0019FDA938|nr:Rieske 2Fe-2S domain-containing protein [Chlorogloeopsis fritschii]MBF2008111.1 Rieske 2Fe-2S domain-containing protein [Chlorogloeopsis fritschii C42_A2020_084]